MAKMPGLVPRTDVLILQLLQAGRRPPEIAARLELHVVYVRRRISRMRGMWAAPAARAS